MINEPVQATMLVIRASDQLEVPYAIGGSSASAVHGVMRVTFAAIRSIDELNRDE
jgi:hypothetical protein